MDYIAERAAADVTIAKAVSDVSFSDRVLRVTFDPAKEGMDQETFDGINPFKNPYDDSESLADFVSTLMSFGNNVGVRQQRGRSASQSDRQNRDEVCRRDTGRR